MPTRVFISYAKEDNVVARKLYSDLQRAGIAPWLDSHDLLPGQPWEAAIVKAIKDSSYFIALLSSRSVGKKGFVQKEIRRAVEIAEEYPENQVFIIPLRIDECEPSFEHLRSLHRADLFPSYEDGLRDLLRVFTYPEEVKPTLARVDSIRRFGLIKRLTDKGFGFLSPADAGKDVFFHVNELRGVLFTELREGDSVSFSLGESSKGQSALDVQRL